MKDSWTQAEFDKINFDDPHQIQSVNNVLVVSSLTLAEHFEKKHYDVLRSIREIQEDEDEDFNQRNFALVEYKDAKGEFRPAYNVTRDGFSLLGFSFTGKKALAFKKKYIETFNLMEAQLTKPKELDTTSVIGMVELLLDRLKVEQTRVLELEIDAGIRGNFRTVSNIPWLSEYFWRTDGKICSVYGEKLKALSLKMGYALGPPVEGCQYPVNIYHLDIIAAWKDQLDADLTYMAKWRHGYVK